MEVITGTLSPAGGARSSDQAPVHLSIVIAADKILADFIAALGGRIVTNPKINDISTSTKVQLLINSSPVTVGRVANNKHQR